MRAFDLLRGSASLWLERAPTLELPKVYLAPALSGAIVLAAIAAWTAFDAAALHASHELRMQAEVRVERLQREISRLRLARAEFEASARQLRRVRDIRRSGFQTAERIVRLGNAVVKGTSLTSIAYGASAPATVKGNAAGVAQLAALLANVVRDRAGGRLTAVRFSSDAHAQGGLAFELQLVDGDRGNDR